MEIDDDEVRYELLNNRKYRVLFVDKSNKKSNTNKVKKIKQNRH